MDRPTDLSIEDVPHASPTNYRDIRHHLQRDCTLTGMTLREVLHAHIPTLTCESTVRDAVDKMDVYQFPALVIVDADQKPVAVLTEGDLCRAVSHQDSIVSMSSQPAFAYATKDPTTVPAETEIGEAFHRMLMSGLTIFPVTESGRLSGVVLRVNLMQAMLVNAQMGRR